MEASNEIDDFHDYLLTVRHFSPHTAKSYKTDVEQFLSQDGVRQCAQEFALWIKRMGYSDGTQSRKLASVRQFQKWQKHTTLYAGDNS